MLRLPHHTVCVGGPFQFVCDVYAEELKTLHLLCCPQVVRIGRNTSATLILNTGAPQGCVLSPPLYSLFTHDCMARHDSNTIIKFVDDTTVAGQITDNDETAYREEVRALSGWCQNNDLSLNVTKTTEMIVDYRKMTSSECVPFTVLLLF